MPSLAGIDTPEQGADASTTPPEAESGGDVGEPGEASKSTIVPIPRPRPEGLTPFTAATPEPPEPAETLQTSVADVALDLKPGSVIKGAKGLIPIPAPKPLAP